VSFYLEKYVTILSILFTLLGSAGIILAIWGGAQVFTYVTSSCHGEGVDFEHYFRPGILFLLAGIAIFVLALVLSKVFV